MSQTSDNTNAVNGNPTGQNQTHGNPINQVPDVIPVIEEQVFITKEVVESGKLLISKTVQEVQELINVPISYEEHEVHRVPVNKIIETAPPPVRHEGETIIIPVIREELVVQKRLVLVEEVHVTKRRVTKTVQESLTLRKEKLTVEHFHKTNPVFPNNNSDPNNPQSPR